MAQRDKAGAEHNVHENHRARMQQRVQTYGLESLADHELLEYLLFFVIPRRDTNPLAHRLIDHFGGLHQVLDASYDHLLEVEGIGPASARLLSTYLPVNRCYLRSRAQRAGLETLEKQAEYLLPLFHGQNMEIVYELLLDDRFRLLRAVRLAEGVSNSVQLDTKKAVAEALRSGATTVVLAHNHPGGYEVPSADDAVITGKLMQQLDVVGIALLDHIIVAQDRYLSMRATGRLPRLRNGSVEMEFLVSSGG